MELHAIERNPFELSFYYWEWNLVYRIVAIANPCTLQVESTHKKFMHIKINVILYNLLFYGTQSIGIDSVGRKCHVMWRDRDKCMILMDFVHTIYFCDCIKFSYEPKSFM